MKIDYHVRIFILLQICTAGWEGWGCEDGAAYQGWNAFLTGLCLLTVSNVFFIPPTIIAIRRRLYAQALLFTATMIASIFYHACDNEVRNSYYFVNDIQSFSD